MFELIRADIDHKIRASEIRPEDRTFFRTRIAPLLEFGTLGVIVYRFGYWAYSVEVPIIRQLVIALYLSINVLFMALAGIHIARESKIGPGFVVNGFSGIFVLANEIGHSCTVNTGVSIMNVRGFGRATIGNNCYFGEGCKVVGGQTIGDNVVVNAGSVVMTDVRSGATVFGAPAREIAARSKARVDGSAGEMRTGHNGSIETSLS